MSVTEILARLRETDVELAADGDELVVRSAAHGIDPALVALLRANKPGLLAWLRAQARAADAPWTDALEPAEAARVVEAVPGGAANVKDVYPLAPLQEGILFHHLLGTPGDPYLIPTVLGFDTRARLDAYVAALQAVAERHDVLRTAIAWEGLREPVQVVWRRAPLRVEEVEPDPAGGGAVERLLARFDPRHHRIDLRAAPLVRLHAARDGDGDGWVLLMLVHHLVGDHLTLELLQGEVRAHLRGEADRLPAPPPFRAFVARTRAEADRAGHERFFAEMLADVEEPTAPFGLLDVQGDGSGIAEASLPVRGDLAARLREAARRVGAGTAALAHVAWALVLARVSGRRDVVFGTLLLGRTRGGPGADRVMGPLINTLPVRLRVAEEGVEAGVRRMHLLLAELLGHEHAPLTLAQRCSGVRPPTPLFSALLNYRRAAPAGRAADWPGVRQIHLRERSNYPLTLSVDDLGDGLRLTAKVQSRVEPARVCAMMHAALEGVAAALENEPGAPLAGVDVLPEEERREVLEAWNRTAAEYPDGACAHDAFEARAAHAPDAVAVVCGDERVTYAALNARANRLAHALRARGVGPDARVGICVERSVEMVVGVLAVLKAGGAYVPLDPQYPGDRLRYMLADSAPAVLLTQAALAERFGGAGVPVMAVDGADPSRAGFADTNPERGALRPDHVAFVVYTSGSTGRPKGVMNPHRAMANRLAWMRREWGLRASGAMLQSSSLSFDASAWEVLLPLSVGARLVLARPAAHRDPARLVETVRAEGVTTLFFVASLLRLFLEAPGVEGCENVARVLCGGEPLSPRLVRRLRERLPGAALHNLYGPSEAAVAVTTPVAGAEDRPVPIGRPAANMRVYLLDGAGAPVPVGVPGELHVGGVQLARGYLGRPGLTAERFAPDPLSGRPGARLYRTGDLGRRLPDGTIEFLGRNDDQVKVRGHRIELGEIEARLLEHPSVREAAVSAPDDGSGDRRLVAYHVGGEVGAEALRRHLSERLPEYMVPAAYVRLENLPLTPSGKLNRSALPAPGGDAYARTGWEAPEGETEAALAEIWSEVLGVERVGRRDHFFALGGHSLLAIQVVSRVRRVLGAEARIEDLFLRPVLAELARGLERAGRADLPPIVPVGRGGPLEASFAQQRLWFLDRLGSAGRAYHVPTSIRLAGALDAAALRRALDRIVARHEALRTTFVAVDGEPAQRVAPVEESGFPLAEHDLAASADAEAELARLAADEAGAPFDLARGPLIRGRLVRLAEDGHALLVTMHHIVSDAQSMAVLVRELSVLYAAFLRGEADPLPPPPVQYADYAAWQRRWVDGEVLRRQAAYWERTLAGAPEVLELPADRPRPPRQDHAGASVAIELDDGLTAGLRALGRRHGATLFMTLLAGWAAVLGRLAGADDVVVGAPSANRGRSEIEGLIGFFVNTLALRVDLSGAPTVAELLGRVRARVLEGQQHQDLPFEQVVERVRPARSVAHTPVFQVVFAWQYARADRLELPGLKAIPPGPPPFVSAKFDLALSLVEVGGRVAGNVTYATALYDRATVERFAGYLRRALEAMAADDGRIVSRLPLLPDAERRRVLEAWNAAASPVPADTCVHEPFEARAARAPDAAAVVFGERRLGYAELNARANRLAHRLREHGVGPDARVAVCVERGVETMVAALAVLKAGGAYVPLDPAHPADRLRFVLDDCAPRAVLAGGALRERFAGAGLPVLDPADPDLERHPATNPDRRNLGLGPDHLAYVIYTSGSTGRPKGVMNTHRAVVNLLAWAQETWALRAGEAVLQRMPFSFDVSVRELFWPLAAGARVVIARAEGANDPAALVETIRAEEVGTLHSVPTLLRALLEHPEAERCRSLTRVMCGGEVLTSALVRRFHEVLPHASLYQMYGPTETTVAVTARRCPPGEGAGRVPLGRPVPNTRIYVLDGDGEPVPAGVAGEIHVGGAQTARGYVNRPGLTAERFVADPFSPGPGARMYRTGDVGRWRPDGTLEFLGRDDGQVKVRGHRIELGEIEARLRELSGVAEAAVLVREDAPGDPRLVAYFAGADGLEAEALRAHLAARLPAYMVPAAYVRLGALPLTSNGKVDRRALPAPDGSAFPGRAYEPPQGATEEALAAIWSELLAVERVGRGDHFFRLGGHSLLATRLVLRIEREMEVPVALADVFEMPVLSALAEHLRRAQLAQFDPEELELLARPSPGTDG